MQHKNRWKKNKKRNEVVASVALGIKREGIGSIIL